MPGVVETFVYVKSLPKPMRRYWFDLEPCCKSAFIAADVERDGNPEAFDCRNHGRVDVARDLSLRLLAKHGVEQIRVLTCEGCGQKNRVDLARVLAEEVVPRCGKCGAFLRGR